jgi:uncharacterized membrane protein YtjA (UPF0391 family)
MIKLSLIFLVVAIIAAIFGFGGISEAATDIALILFFVALAIFLVTLIIGLVSGKKTGR